MENKISIVVPCYNQAQYLDECLNSVINQIYQNWECIIVNDGSQDNTEEMATIWTQRDNRFKYIKKENGGLSSARNEGIKNAKGKYILPLDSDDKISIDYVSKAIEIFTENAITTLVYCNAWLFGNKEELWKLPDYEYFRLLCGNVIFCSAIFRKEEWNIIGGYDESLKNGHEDWDFWLRLLNKDSIVVRLPIVGFFYRQKSISMLAEIEKSERRKHIDNYIFMKQIPVIETYFDKSFPLIIKEYLEIKKNANDIRTDYKILAKQIKISNLFKAFLIKIKYNLFNKFK
jgi:glycosyltransferase involved in cell wall biosynthesis